MRDLARRWKELDAEAKSLGRQIEALVAHVAPELVDVFGVSSELAGQFLVTVGDNTERIRNEAAFCEALWCLAQAGEQRPEEWAPSPQPRW